jgi:hypothetical protein
MTLFFIGLAIGGLIGTGALALVSASKRGSK